MRRSEKKDVELRIEELRDEIDEKTACMLSSSVSNYKSNEINENERNSSSLSYDIVINETANFGRDRLGFLFLEYKLDKCDHEKERVV